MHKHEKNTQRRRWTARRSHGTTGLSAEIPMNGFLLVWEALPPSNPTNAYFMSTFVYRWRQPDGTVSGQGAALVHAHREGSQKRNGPSWLGLVLSCESLYP